MQFFKALGLVASLAATASALPQGYGWQPWQPTATTTVAVSVPSTTATPSWASPSASASGTAAPSPSSVTIVNNLDQEVYLWSTGDDNGQMQTLRKGQSYQENWRTRNSGGISIKIGLTPNCLEGEIQSVLQYEYTLVPSGQYGGIFWDLSSINLAKDSAFIKAGFKVVPSIETCPQVQCDANDVLCPLVYQTPTDNHAAHGCPSDTSFVMHLG